MQAKKLNHVTLQEYLDIEIETQQKYEFHNGRIYAMSGGTLNHGWVCGNIFGEIREGLRKKDSNCRVMNSEIKLNIKAKNSYVYPDAMVVCGEIDKSKTEINAVTNPVVIVEVLSKTTESYDRGDKFFMYQKIATLKEYILIEQDKPQIEIFSRTGDLWSIKRVTGIDKMLEISSLNLSIAFDEIYRDIELVSS